MALRKILITYPDPPFFDSVNADMDVAYQEVFLFTNFDFPTCFDIKAQFTPKHLEQASLSTRWGVRDDFCSFDIQAFSREQGVEVLDRNGA